MTDLRQPADPQPSASGSTPAKRASIRRVSSRELLAGDQEIIIVHAGREYRLRVTSNGKLILTA